MFFKLAHNGVLAYIINAYRGEFNNFWKNKNYNYLVSIAPKPQKHTCHVCGKYVFADIDDFDICSIL